MKTQGHADRTHVSRERVNASSPTRKTGRAKRREQMREFRKAVLIGKPHDPRAVKFHF
jgi:hypothetical protein